jgi:hypothetical protein
MNGEPAMTTTTTSARYRDHTVVGNPDQLANLIANHTTAGTLLGISAPQPRQDGRLAVVLRLRDTTPQLPTRQREHRAAPVTRTHRPARSPARPAVPHPADMSTYPARVDYRLTIRVRSPRSRRRHRVGLVVTAAIAVLAAVVFAAGWLLSRIAAIHLDGPTLLGILAVALLIAAALRGTGNSGKRHCPGCH